MNKKDLTRQYKETLRPMGVFQVRNLTNEKVFVGSTLNLDGIFNRFEFQLKMDGHPNKKLQTDWNALGAENFAFEILEELPPRENPGYDYKQDLEVLEDLWLEKLEPYEDNGYNERKKTFEERLQMIRANRKL
ncbi:MAG: GIY-YIG nuclease family protein [Pyrinomonadaceae bacterium]